MKVNLPEDWEYAEIYAVSDVHIGDALFNHVEFHKFVEYVLEDPHRLILLNGDIINNNLINSVGSPYEDLISPNDQKKEARRMLEPLRKRILVATGGNHENRTMRAAGLDITEEIAEWLGVPYRENEAIVKLSIGSGRNGKPVVYTLYMTHGSGGGKRPGSKLNNLEDLSRNIFADIYVVGHWHSRIGHKPIFRFPDHRHDRIVEVSQLFTASAGWLNYGGYAMQKMMRPQIRGAHPITISGTRKEATTTI